jgi:hypothetical protein
MHEAATKVGKLFAQRMETEDTFRESERRFFESPEARGLPLLAALILSFSAVRS